VTERHCDERELLLVVRKADGALTLAASSDHLITFWSRQRHTWVISTAEFRTFSRESGSEGGKDSQAIGVALEDYQSRLQTVGG
jgi:hypothetical protein